MSKKDSIIIRGLRQNNLKNVSLDIPKEKITVFTGVSGSGKSSIVFDTIAAESQRQMNETYSAWIRGRLPKYEKPNVDYIDNLTSSVIVDQSRLGGNVRSTVGTISDMYAALRLLFSRIGVPSAGPSSNYSFNNPNGMCPVCCGIGKVMELDLLPMINAELSWNEGMVDLPSFHPGNYYWKMYTESGLFDNNKKWKDYTEKERNILLYGAEEKGGKPINEKIKGLHNYWEKLLLKRDIQENSERSILRLQRLVKEKTCPSCHGKRLNNAALSSLIKGYSIYDMCQMEFSELRKILRTIDDSKGVSVAQGLCTSLTRMIDIGLPYLFMNRESSTLSGGEAQRLKLVRYMGSSLTGMTYIFDEPSVGMHPRDVHRMTELLKSLRDKGNTVLVVEHDKDIISIADHIVDVGPLAGKEGGQIIFQGSYNELLQSGTRTGVAMKTQIAIKNNPRQPQSWLPIRDASIHNLKHIDVDIPLGILTVVTGVAGSGKSSLIRDFFTQQYADRVVLVDQSAVSARGRSTICTYLGFFDSIRNVFAEVNHVEAGMFSFNSTGACPHCSGRGAVTTELVFMDPTTALCEYCNGTRYSTQALSYLFKGKSIVDILNMSVEEALPFFNDIPKVYKSLKALKETGVSYLSLGQPLSTLSGGERQRVKLAKELRGKGNIYVLDEPTTGLHASDIVKIMELLNAIVDHGNTVIIIEHNNDVMKMADYIIDVGPDGGSAGGEIVFTGTPLEMVTHSDSITAQYLRKD